MNKEFDEEKTRRLFERGVKNVSESDVEDVLRREEELRKKGHVLGDTLEQAKLLFQMIKDWKSGEYKDVPWKVISAIVFAIVYFLFPADAIPDFIPGIGWIDDVFVFSLVLKSFSSQIKAYRTRKSRSLSNKK